MAATPAPSAPPGRDAGAGAGAAARKGAPDLRQLFDDALEREPSERRAFLEAACGEDRGLLAELLELLEVQERAVGFLERPIVEGAGAPVALPDPISYRVVVALDRRGDLARPRPSLRAATPRRDPTR